MEKVEKTETSAPQVNAYRKVLTTTNTQLIKGNGWQAEDKVVAETLAEMFQCALIELGRTTHLITELSGRSHPVPGEAIVAVITMGLRLEGIEAFSKRPGRPIIPLPATAAPQRLPSLLQAGAKPSHPSNMPGFLPPLPDAHAYVRTPTHKQPVTEYEAIREKAALQKKDMDKSLVRFLCKTQPTESLFEAGADNLFPLIAPQEEFPTYASALNPTDQVFDFEELEYHYLVANRTEDIAKDEGEESGNEDDEKGEEKPAVEGKQDDIQPNSTVNRAILSNPNIDNPYLRAASLPKRSKANTIRI